MSPAKQIAEEITEPIFRAWRRITSFAVPYQQTEELKRVVASALTAARLEGAERVAKQVGKTVCVYQCKNNTIGPECYGFFHPQKAGTCVCQCHKYIVAAHSALEGLREDAKNLTEK